MNSPMRAANRSTRTSGGPHEQAPLLPANEPARFTDAGGYRDPARPTDTSASALVGAFAAFLGLDATSNP
jgi:hypothetical protein